MKLAYNKIIATKAARVYGQLLAHGAWLVAEECAREAYKCERGSAQERVWREQQELALALADRIQAEYAAALALAGGAAAGVAEFRVPKGDLAAELTAIELELPSTGDGPDGQRFPLGDDD